MNYRSNVAAIACLSVIGMGITGCGSSNKAKKPVDPVDPVVVIPDYAKPVMINATTTEAALAAINGDDDGIMLTANENNTNSAFSTINVKASKQIKSLKIADAAYGAQGKAGDDSGETDITLDCAYSGSFHLVTEWHDAEYERGEIGEITFDNCIHNEPLLDMMDGIGMMDTGSERFVHSGSIKVENQYTRFDDTRQELHGMSAVNLSMVVNVDDVKVFELAANGAMNFTQYRAGDLDRFEEDINGTISTEEFAPDGTVEDGFALEGKEFNIEYRDEGNSESMLLNGYLSVTEDLENKYVYGEEFTYVGVEEGEIESETFNGVLGTSCIGGTVTFATSASWDTNDSQLDIDGEEGETPFAGTTTISGAESTSATVNFAEDEGISYGTITIDGVEGDHMSRKTMSKDACPDED